MTERDEQTSLRQRLNRWRRRVDNGAVATRIAPRKRGGSSWVETIAITTLACGIAWWSRPGDPLLLTTSFPWLWFAPWLIALRYGVTLGGFSVLLLTLDWSMFSRLAHPGDPHFPLPAFIGGLLCTIICGEFHAIWTTRLERRDEANLYLEDRLSRLTRRYFMMQLSNDRLEQMMLAQPGSLRNALRHLRDIETRRPDTSSPLPGIDYVLQLLSQYCRLEAAAVFVPIRNNAGAWVVGEPVAKIGNPPPVENDDPMLADAMDRRELTHVATELTDTGKHLIMVPILGAEDDVAGILVVSSMPFLAFNRDTLQILALLLGYYGDMLQVNPDVDRIQRILPDCPYEFAAELVRLCRVAARIDVDSYLLVMAFDGAVAKQAADEVERSRRGLDMVWRSERTGKLRVVVLLPFANAAARRGYRSRMEHWLSENFGEDFVACDAEFHELALGDAPPLNALVALLQDPAPTAVQRIEVVAGTRSR